MKQPGPDVCRTAINCAVLTFIALLTAVLSIGCSPKTGEITLPIPRDALQTRVAEQFPLKKGKVTFREPEILLQEGTGRVGLRSSVEAPLGLGINARGVVAADGRLRYEPATGTFFLDEPSVVDFRLEGISGKVTETAKTAITPVLQALYPTIPVYTLDESAGQRVAQKVLRDVRISNGQVLVTFGAPR